MPEETTIANIQQQLEASHCTTYTMHDENVDPAEIIILLTLNNNYYYSIHVMAADNA